MEQVVEEAMPRRRPKERKQQILRRARDLFLEYGYPDVTMASVAAGVGITAGALYRHYTNKSHLLEEVFRDAFTHLQGPFEASGDIDEMFGNALHRVTELSDVADLWRTEWRYLPDAYRKDVRERLLLWVRSFIELARAVRPGLDEGQAMLLGWAMQSVLTHPREATRGYSAEQRDALLVSLLHAILGAELVSSGETTSESLVDPPVQSMRERLLLAAIRLFGEQGYQAVSMDAIGAAAAVTGPNLYSHFASKADLLRAAYERGVHAAWLGLEVALDDAGDAGEALRGAVASHTALEPLWIQVRGRRARVGEASEQAHRDSAEYLAEWVYLVQRAVPGIERSEARMRVLIAFALADDLRHTGPVRHFEGYRSNLNALMVAVLTAPLNL